MAKRIVHVVTNVAHYDDPSHPTGLWLSELTHAWDVFAEHGIEQRIVSPKGGKVPLEPRALKAPLLDASARSWLNDPGKMALLDSTARPDDVDPGAVDGIYFTGGHAVMWDFPDDAGLQQLTRTVWEAGGIVAAVCHGYCGLLNTRLSDGSLLVEDKNVTGFSWNEEVLAGVAASMPYNAEAEMKKRGARYRKALVPFVSYVVDDGRLITGQNPFSAKATAKRIVESLWRRHVADRVGVCCRRGLFTPRVDPPSAAVDALPEDVGDGVGGVAVGEGGSFGRADGCSRNRASAFPIRKALAFVIVCVNFYLGSN